MPLSVFFATNGSRPRVADSREDHDPGAENSHMVLLQLPSAEVRPRGCGSGCCSSGSSFGGDRKRRLTGAAGGDSPPDDPGGAQLHSEVLQVGAALPPGFHEKWRRDARRGVEGSPGRVRRGVHRAWAVRSANGGEGTGRLLARWDGIRGLIG